MKLSETQARVLAAVGETIAAGDAPTVAAIAARAERGTTATRKALRALEEHGVLRRVDRVGQSSDYVLATPTLDPNADPNATPTPDPNDPNASTPTPAEFPSRERAEGLPSPLTSRPPATAPVAGHAGEGERATPNAPTPQRPDAVVSIGKAVVAWACDEVARLGKAPLDGSLIKRIGATALAMDKGGVSASDLKLAAETLVRRDMTDLQAAHRKAQSGGASPFAPAPDADPLAARAAASAASRAERIAAGEQQNESPHRPEEMVEVQWFIAYTWGQRYSDARLAAWSAELARLPVTVILHALRKLVRRGEHLRFPPTWGEVARIGEHDFDEWLWRSGRKPGVEFADPFADRPSPPWGGEE